MLVQTYSKNKDTCLTDGRFPARAFCEDYLLLSVIQLIEKHVNIVSETNRLKASLSNFLQQSSSQTIHPDSDQYVCQLCFERHPPDPSKVSEV